MKYFTVTGIGIRIHLTVCIVMGTNSNFGKFGRADLRP
jgi:hypothetical protein